MSRENRRSWCYERPYNSEAETVQASNEIGTQYQQGNSSWCWGRPCHDNPWNGNNEADININACINIWQDGEANGGDGEGGDGGDGGDATGGNAIAANAESGGEGNATIVISNSSDPQEDNGSDYDPCINPTSTLNSANSAAQKLKDLTPEQLQAFSPEQLQALQSLLDLNLSGLLGIAIGDAAAIGGTAAGGNGGNGGVGTGGDGGTIVNTANATIDQVVIIMPDGNGPYPSISLGSNAANINRNVDIKVDEKGNTFVNGQKMDEQELANGTKVLIFRNSETKEFTKEFKKKGTAGKKEE